MIFIPKICGTCAGATRALNLVYSLKDNKKNVVVYKPILHNEEVIADLERNNIKCFDSLEYLNKENLVVIRAHGEAKSTYDYLKSKNIEFCDATCPNVTKIHKIINERYNNGYSIVIIGKKNHPEVIGSNGWCENKAFIIENSEDVKKLIIENNKILVIAQTTISEKLFNTLSKKIKNKFSKCEIECLNTVCLAQKNIQKSSIKMAKKARYTFVVGGVNSSNTKELFNLCKDVSDSYLFSNINEFISCVKKLPCSLNDNFCITGGASTPLSEIEKYKNFLFFYLNYSNFIETFDKKLLDINLSFSNLNDNKIVIDAVEKFQNINYGGKYLRGYLIDLGYSSFGNKKCYSNSLSLAYETFQTAILVHDDIIDKSFTRRGKSTIQEVYKKDFSLLNNKACDTANSLALCIGDLGFYLANQIIVKAYNNDKNLANVLEYFNDIVINTIKGEIIDVYLPFKEQFLDIKGVKLEDILEIFKLKTSWYTIVGPFCLGMTLAGAKKDDISKYEKMLLPLGIAFQIKDDLLGIFSDSSSIGKDCSDISEYKQTLLYYYVINNDSYGDELLNYYGKENLDSDDILKVRDIFEKSGAKKYAQDMMQKYFTKSKDELNKLKLPEDLKNIILGFITYLEYRDK